MSAIQHQLAHQLLSLIRKANATNRLLTYQTAAEQLGRPIDNARAIAQVCDLLDAAAALAETPLLALVAVRTASGDINPKAWKEGVPAGARESIIKRSLAHTFTDDDFVAIEKALDALKGYGNHAAWVKVKKSFPDGQLLQHLSTSPPIDDQDAVNDLGADVPDKVFSAGMRYARDPRVRKAVEARANGQCELCGKQGFIRPDGSRYLETHHIIALAKDGADRVTNVIALCAEHHREAHYGVARENLEQEMIAKVKGLCAPQST